jgi:hypothetical protein
MWTSICGPVVRHQQPPWLSTYHPVIGDYVSHDVDTGSYSPGPARFSPDGSVLLLLPRATPSWSTPNRRDHDPQSGRNESGWLDFSDDGTCAATELNDIHIWHFDRIHAAQPIPPRRALQRSRPVPAAALPGALTDRAVLRRALSRPPHPGRHSGRLFQGLLCSPTPSRILRHRRTRRGAAL